MEELTSYKLACIVARLLDNKLAKDITILNIENVSSFSDYFVICSADTTTQVGALTGTVKEKMKYEFGRMPNSEEHDTKKRWNLIDYSDVVVHILHREEREFYAIKKFWNNACTIPQETWQKETEDLIEKLR